MFQHFVDIRFQCAGARQEALCRETDRLQNGVAAAQRLFDALTARDIRVRTRHAVGFAAAVPDGCAARQYPAIGAVFVAQAMLYFIKSRLTVEVAVERNSDAFLIFGMNARTPFLKLVGQLVVGIAQHRLPAGREVHLVGADVPIP